LAVTTRGGTGRLLHVLNNQAATCTKTPTARRPNGHQNNGPSKRTTVSMALVDTNLASSRHGCGLTWCCTNDDDGKSHGNPSPFSPGKASTPRSVWGPQNTSICHCGPNELEFIAGTPIEAVNQRVQTACQLMSAPISPKTRPCHIPASLSGGRNTAMGVMEYHSLRIPLSGVTGTWGFLTYCTDYETPPSWCMSSSYPYPT
jgi:hypothetical protein